jgi:undecaprenyl-diphosphatase
MKKVLEKILREPVLLTFVILAAGGIWAFVELAEAVSEGSAREVDEWTILVMRNPADKADPVGPRWFEEMMRDYTALGGYGVLTALTIAVVIYLWLRQQHEMALLVLSAVVGGVVLSTLLKSVFDRPRPDLVPHGAIVYSKSFPSGHAMMSAATYLTLGAMLAQAEKSRRLKFFFIALGLLLTLIVGVSRVYLGVHWPTDVLAGWAAGGAWALACWSVAHIIERRTHRLHLPNTAPEGS